MQRETGGKVISDSYVDKRFIQFPSVEVIGNAVDKSVHKFSANLGKFFEGGTGDTTTANYYYFDASGIKIILDRPITEEGYVLVMFQMKKKKNTLRDGCNGYRFTHLTNSVGSLVPAALQGINF